MRQRMILTFTTLVLFGSLCNAQKLDSLSFIRIDSSDNQVVKWDQMMSVTACYADSNEIHHREYMSGTFLYATLDSLYLNIDLYRHNQFDMLDSLEHQFYRDFEIDYNQSGDVKRILKGFARENICNISLDKHHTSRSILNLLSGIGIFNALVVAPLVSINYKTGVFNSSRYYKYAAVSLASTIVTFSMSRTLLPKKYKFGSSEKRRYIFN